MPTASTSTVRITAFCHMIGWSNHSEGCNGFSPEASAAIARPPHTYSTSSLTM
jgi:hypothetical protein